jgi:hypothetical protein
VAKRLELTHFVGTMEQNLASVSQCFQCRCFQFIQDGVRGQATAARLLGSAAYPVVRNWTDLLAILLGP